MPEEVLEEVFQKKVEGHDDKHCRCYKHKEPKSKQEGVVEEVTLQKSTYFTRVATEYSGQRALKTGPRTQKAFLTLRDECLRANKLYQDPEFPPNDFSINFDGVTRRQYEWKRPHEFCKDPHLFVEGASRFDIQQGELGDCWLLASVCNLTLNPRLFHVVVPRDQSFTQYYAGIFHFRFWQYGKWEDVIIDDMLPTYHNQLMFMHSKTKNEFWCALLEKAYAKLYGGYEALKGGNINESMVDLTGGVVEMIDLRDPPSNLFKVMMKANQRAALIGCAIEPDHPNIQAESILTNGLIVRHAYSVTRVNTVNKTSASTKLQGQAQLVRLHNPWGNETEWEGAWSDKSPEWNTITPETRKNIGLTFDDDGEFWMSYQDFISNFTTLEICDVSPEVFDLGDEDDDDSSVEGIIKKWQMIKYEGAWVPHQSAGGCRNFLNTFASNPQYTVVLEDPDEDDDDDLCTLVVSIMQKNVRQMKRYGADYIPIGYTLYKKPENKALGEKLDTEYFKYNLSTEKVPFFLNTREVTHRFRLPPGAYVIVCSTFEPNMAGEFLLRIFSEAKRIKT